MRTPGAALIFDPEATFSLSEADLPHDTMAQLSKDCDDQFNQDSVKRPVADSTARLEHLLNNHLWAQHEIDDEAYARLDIIIHVLWRICTDAGAHGP